MPTEVALDFDPDADTVAARFTPRQWEGRSWEAAGTYIADDDFAGSNITNDPASPNQFQVAEDPALLCDCSYLSWGTWNASIDANGTTYSADAGYWVVGQMTAQADLPLSGEATYNGTVIGTVSDDQGITPDIRGDFTATIDFADGLGTVQISGFAGRSFGDDNLDINNMSEWAFAGALGDGADLTGEYQAGFASDGIDPAAAMIGTFSVEDPNAGWSASGVFGGTRDGTGGTPP